MTWLLALHAVAVLVWLLACPTVGWAAVDRQQRITAARQATRHAPGADQ